MVAVTNLPADGDPLYRVLSQVGDVGVVRPVIPTVAPETSTFRRGADGAAYDHRVVAPSTLAIAGATVLTDAERDTLGTLLIAVHDHFEGVYPELRPLRLDIEAELVAPGVIVLKQVRPFLGTPE
jgi:hypothetical protein